MIYTKLVYVKQTNNSCFVTVRFNRSNTISRFKVKYICKRDNIGYDKENITNIYIIQTQQQPIQSCNRTENSNYDYIIAKSTSYIKHVFIWAKKNLYTVSSIIYGECCAVQLRELSVLRLSFKISTCNQQQFYCTVFAIKHFCIDT